MAFTVTIKNPNGLPSVSGVKREVWGTILLTNSYTTGGYAISPASDLKLPPECTIYSMTAQPVSGFVFEWDGVNNKLKVNVSLAVYTATFDPASLANVTSRDDAITFTGVAATDVSAGVVPPNAASASVVVQNHRVTGANTTTARLTNPSAGAVDLASGTFTNLVTAASGALHEAPSTTDLSAVTTKFYCVAAV